MGEGIGEEKQREERKEREKEKKGREKEGKEGRPVVLPLIFGFPTVGVCRTES